MLTGNVTGVTRCGEGPPPPFRHHRRCQCIRRRDHLALKVGPVQNSSHLHRGHLFGGRQVVSRRVRNRVSQQEASRVYLPDYPTHRA